MISDPARTASDLSSDAPFVPGAAVRPDDLARFMAGAGLPAPPVPDGLALRRWDEWLFATAEPAESPWNVGAFVGDAVAGAGPLLLVAHAGYGVSSVALHYFLVLDGLALFLQVPWGGAYTDDAAAVRALERAYGRVETLLARTRAALPPGERLFVVDAVGGGRWARVGAGADAPDWRDAAAPMTAALAALGA